MAILYQCDFCDSMDKDPNSIRQFDITVVPIIRDETEPAKFLRDPFQICDRCADSLNRHLESCQNTREAPAHNRRKEDKK